MIELLTQITMCILSFSFVCWMNVFLVQKIERCNPNHIPVFFTITFLDFDQLLLFFFSMIRSWLVKKEIIPDFCAYLKYKISLYLLLSYFVSCYINISKKIEAMNDKANKVLKNKRMTFKWWKITSLYTGKITPPTKLESGIN
jgi:hypothetical protein